MAQPTIQASFNSGEWAPSLYARVDLQKYHSGAATLRNFFVDYRGGASTRVGTKYILQAYKSATTVRLIPFQAAKNLGFALEFGDGYIRFHRNGAPVLETGLNITGATQASPCVVSVTNTYAVGDWVYISGVAGMTELNGKYYVVHAASGTDITLYDLFGNPVDATAYGAWTSGGTTERVYTLTSPYAAADLATIKYAQNVDVLILCHTSYAPQILTYVSATNWTISPITFGTTVTAPTGVTLACSLGAGGTNYSYVVTAVDANGQESVASTAGTGAFGNIRVTAGTVSITWTAASGAQSYNVYRADVAQTGPVPAGAPHGYIGNFTGTTAIDSNIAPDFSTTPPVAQNPFVAGSSVSSTTITAAGSYTTAPTLVFDAAPGGGSTATGTPNFTPLTAAVSDGGSGYLVGDTLTFADNTVLTVASVTGPPPGPVATVTFTSKGTFATTLPTLPVGPTSTSGSGTDATFDFTWGVSSITLTNPGLGYLSAPGITFSAGAATATAALGTSGSGNPAIPAFFQQRLVLAGPSVNPQRLFMSQPGEYFNFNKSTPIQADDAIQADIVSGQLNNIKALIPQSGGLIVLTDGASFLINGGSLGAAVTPSTISANPQSFIGCNDMPPIVVNFDILNVQSKGWSVRDSSYNFYANVYTGTDISIIASHLFFGYQLTEWAWAEEPYKIVWSVRNDGTLLSLTFLKEQEFIGWTHHDTTGSFKSVCAIVEAASAGYQNFTYFVIERTVQGQTLQYVEYFPERIYTNGVSDAVTVDCCYQYSGSAATSFTGATALAGLTCTGLADGVIIPSFVMPTNGSFTLGTAASKVTVGLAFTPQLKTLYLDIAEGPGTVQSKQKKINAVTLRVTETLGLQAGTTFSNLVDVKDLVRGNVGSMTNALVTDLVTGDVRPWLDPKWDEAGQYCFQQSYPYPATILGVFPQVSIGDTAK